MFNDQLSTSSNLLRLFAKIALVVAFVVCAKLGFDWLAAKITLLEQSASARAMKGLIITVLIGYALLIAIPFVPGVEIGVALLMIQGASAAPFVYLATFAGMVIAFLIGQYLSLHWLIGFCDDLRMPRLCALLHRIAEKPPATRLAVMERRLPAWMAPFLVKYRYATVAVLINTPGSIALGGGGGIMLATGLSRLFRTGWMILTIGLATLPIPLFIWLTGTSVLH